jgi:hypothetical protein
MQVVESTSSVLHTGNTNRVAPRNILQYADGTTPSSTVGQIPTSSSQSKSSLRKRKLPPPDNDDSDSNSDSDTDSLVEDVEYDVGLTILNEHGVRGKISKKYQNDGWFMYDVLYFNKKLKQPWDNGLWGFQLTPAPTVPVRKQRQKKQTWENREISDDDTDDEPDTCTFTEKNIVASRTRRGNSSRK